MYFFQDGFIESPVRNVGSTAQGAGDAEDRVEVGLGGDAELGRRLAKRVYISGDDLAIDGQRLLACLLQAERHLDVLHVGRGGHEFVARSLQRHDRHIMPGLGQRSCLSYHARDAAQVLARKDA